MKSYLNTCSTRSAHTKSGFLRITSIRQFARANDPFDTANDPFDTATVGSVCIQSYAVPMNVEFYSFTLAWHCAQTSKQSAQVHKAGFPVFLCHGSVCCTKAACCGWTCTCHLNRTVFGIGRRVSSTHASKRRLPQDSNSTHQYLFFKAALSTVMIVQGE